MASLVVGRLLAERAEAAERAGTQGLVGALALAVLLVQDARLDLVAGLDLGGMLALARLRDVRADLAGASAGRAMAGQPRAPAAAGALGLGELGLGALGLGALGLGALGLGALGLGALGLGALGRADREIPDLAGAVVAPARAAGLAAAPRRTGVLRLGTLARLGVPGRTVIPGQAVAPGPAGRGVPHLAVRAGAGPMKVPPREGPRVPALLARAPTALTLIGLTPIGLTLALAAVLALVLDALLLQAPAAPALAVHVLAGRQAPDAPRQMRRMGAGLRAAGMTQARARQTGERQTRARPTGEPHAVQRTADPVDERAALAGSAKIASPAAAGVLASSRARLAVDGARLAGQGARARARGATVTGRPAVTTGPAVAGPTGPARARVPADPAPVDLAPVDLAPVDPAAVQPTAASRAMAGGLARQDSVALRGMVDLMGNVALRATTERGAASMDR